MRILSLFFCVANCCCVSLGDWVLFRCQSSWKSERVQCTLGKGTEGSQRVLGDKTRVLPQVEFWVYMFPCRGYAFMSHFYMIPTPHQQLVTLLESYETKWKRSKHWKSSGLCESRVMSTTAWQAVVVCARLVPRNKFPLTCCFDYTELVQCTVNICL